MTSSNAPQQPYEPAPEEQVNDPCSPEGPSLDDVVRETLDAQGGKEALAPEVREAFANIARRHASDQALDLPIVKELVDAVLACRLEQFRARPDLRRVATERIAETFWDDTPSRERLERLWKTLREGSP